MIFRKKKYDPEELVRACGKGKAAAQKQLYEQYERPMMALCARYIPQQQEAEDVLMQGFVKVFQKIDSYKFEGSFEGWLRRVFVNECLMHLRKKTHLTASLEQAEGQMATVSAVLEADELLALVQALPTGYRTVFNLYAIEGYSHQEIAQQLGISEGTSKSQLSKARQMLQSRLKTAEKQSCLPQSTSKPCTAQTL